MSAESIEVPFGQLTCVGPRKLVLDGGPDLLRGRGNFWMGGMCQPIVMYSDCAMLRC